MKIKIWPVLLGLFLVYLIKKGVETAESENRTVGIIDALKLGFEVTFGAVRLPILANKTDLSDPDDDGHVNYSPSNDKMVSFTPQLNSFPNAKLRRQRGQFYVFTRLKGIREASVN